MLEDIDIIITDPRNMGGNPYEVADFALGQVEGALGATITALSVAFLMARNSEMERNLALGLPPAGAAFIDGPQGRKFTEVTARLYMAAEALAALRKAASYDPKHPPRAST